MKYNIFIFFLLLSMTAFAQPSQYTPMTAQGYQFKRILCDSTLHLPSFCGVPNLRNSTAKNGALAMDTCNSRLYKWTNGAGWSIVGGTTIDTTSLSNRINTKIDSLKRSTDSIYAKINGSWIFMYKDSIGGGSTPSFQQVTDVGSSTTNSFSGISSPLGLSTDYNLTDIPNLVYYPFYSTDNNPISPYYSYMRLGGFSGIGSEIYNGNQTDWNKINPNVYESGLGTSYVRIIPTYNASDEHYLPISDGQTDTLATLADVRNINTTNLIDSLKRSSDSVYAQKNGQWIFQYKDSIGSGGGGGQTGRFGNDTATVVMAKVHNDAGVQLTNGTVVYLGTSGTSSDAPSVRLANNKQDATSANTFGFVSGTIAINDTGWVILSGKIEKLNTSAFANGDIIYLDSISGTYTKTKPSAPYHLVYLGVVVKANAGNGSIFVKCQNGYELDEIHDVKITSKTNNDVLAYESSTNLWKNKQISTVLGYTPIAPADTSVFQRKQIAAYSIMANNTNAAANASPVYFKDTSGTYNGAITWTGTTPPSNLSVSKYNWTRIGKQVTLFIAVYYTTAGTSLTQVNFDLPADAPTPDVSYFTTLSASNLLYQGLGAMGTSGNILQNNTITNLRRNAANTGYEFQLSGASQGYRRFQITITYMAQ